MNFHYRIGQGIGIVMSAEASNALVWENLRGYALAPALRNFPTTSYRVGLPDVSGPLRSEPVCICRSIPLLRSGARRRATVWLNLAFSCIALSPQSPLQTTIS